MSARRRQSPVRTCVGCRATAEKPALLRVVRDPSGALVIDHTGKAAGRGTYFCCRPECVAKARERNALSHALHVPVPDQFWSLLLETVSEGGSGM